MKKELVLWLILFTSTIGFAQTNVIINQINYEIPGERIRFEKSGDCYYQNGHDSTNFYFDALRGNRDTLVSYLLVRNDSIIETTFIRCSGFSSLTVCKIKIKGIKIDGRLEHQKFMEGEKEINLWKLKIKHPKIMVALIEDGMEDDVLEYTESFFYFDTKEKADEIISIIKKKK